MKKLTWREFYAAIGPVLGIDTSAARKITIEAEYGNLVIVTVEMLAGEKALEFLLDCAGVEVDPDKTKERP